MEYQVLDAESGKKLHMGSMSTKELEAWGDCHPDHKTLRMEKDDGVVTLYVIER